MPPQVQGHVPLQVQKQVPPQVTNDPEIGNAMFEELRASMSLLDQVLTAQANRGEVASANPVRGMGATKVREFLRINPPEFYGSKIDEDPNGFIVR